MAFIKTGDNVKVQGYYIDSSKPESCDQCGEPLTTIALDDSNTLVCKSCDVDEEILDAKQAD